MRLVAASAVQSAVGATGEIGGEVGVAVAALEDDRVVVAAGGRDVDGAGVAIAALLDDRVQSLTQRSLEEQRLVGVVAAHAGGLQVGDRERA